MTNGIQQRPIAPDMPEGTEASGKKESSNSDARSLWMAAGAFALLAALFYLTDHYLRVHKAEWWAHIAQHLSIAFTVACVSIIGIEYRAKRRAQGELNRFVEEFRRYREHVSEDVFGAVLGRVVPKPVVKEIEEILRSPVVKRDCEYIITFLPPYEGMPSGYCVLRRDLKFVVENLQEEVIRFPVRSQYAGDEDSTSEAWMGRPFHLKLTDNKDNIEIESDEKVLLDKEKGILEYTVNLEPHAPKEILLRGEEPIRIEAGRCFYSQSTPAEGLQVSIVNKFDNEIEVVDVQMHHPGWAKVDHDANLGRYALRRAFLPGQGFEVVWKRAAKDGQAEAGIS